MTKCFTLVAMVSLVLTACGSPNSPRLERLADRTQLPAHHLESLTGHRDGDALYAKMLLTADASALMMDLRFRIGVPTRLEEGSYMWKQADKILRGQVQQVSTTFLGGQSGRPSVGGSFVLVSPTGVRLYSVRVPVSEVSPDR